MSLPITSIVQGSDGSWTFSWANAGATFYRVVLWGVELQTNVTAFSYTWALPGYADFPPPVEIAYEDDLVLSEIHLPYLAIQWYGEDTAQTYQVQQYVGGTWKTIQTVIEVGQWIYSYQTTILTDATTYQFRVIAVNSVGGQSTPRSYQRFVVCPPKSPDGTVTATIASGNIVVSSI